MVLVLGGSASVLEWKWKVSSFKRQYIPCQPRFKFSPDEGRANSILSAMPKSGSELVSLMTPASCLRSPNS